MYAVYIWLSINTTPSLTSPSIATETSPLTLSSTDAYQHYRLVAEFWRVAGICQSPSRRQTDKKICAFVFLSVCSLCSFVRGHHFSCRKNPQLFQSGIAGNMSNKCAFINVNSPRTSRTKNELQYE